MSNIKDSKNRKKQMYIGMPVDLDFGDAIEFDNIADKNEDSSEDSRIGARDNKETLYYPKDIDRWPVGMTYTPWQQFTDILSDDEAFDAGTIFGQLDLPFTGGVMR